jgi:hypothetical protein
MKQNLVEIGQKFNRLTITDIILKDDQDRHKVACICDCGEVCIRNMRAVYRNQSKSCGCLLKEWHDSPQGKENQKRSSKIGAEKMKLPAGISSFNKIFTVYKSGAKKRNLKFELTENQFKKLIDSNCFYCNICPQQKNFDKKRNGNYTYNGIDRVDNKKGYLIDNCVSCCGKCNEMKMGETQEFFLQKIKMIYEVHFKNRS